MHSIYVRRKHIKSLLLLVFRSCLIFILGILEVGVIPALFVVMHDWPVLWLEGINEE